MFKLLVTTVRDFQDEAESFYNLCGRETQLMADNTLVVAFQKDMLVGIVRLCLEHESYVLRTMQVHPDHQGQGVGLKILDRFQKVLIEREIQTAYCIPYAHLELFYGKIGFAKINELNAPLFLKERINQNRVKKPHEPVILMKRQVKT